MDGYLAELKTLSQEAGYEIQPITKVAVQSGTKHGGVRDTKGQIIKAKVGFNTLAELGKVAREEYGLAGVVQHGASTLPEEYFILFAGNEMPEGLDIAKELLNEEGMATLKKHPAAEVHLATAYQDTAIEHPAFPGSLYNEIRDFILQKFPAKEGVDPQKAFVDARKNAWGPFKQQAWNLPDEVQTAIRGSLEMQFDTVFRNLGVAATSSPIRMPGDDHELPFIEVEGKTEKDKTPDAVNKLASYFADVTKTGDVFFSEGGLIRVTASTSKFFASQFMKVSSYLSGVITQRKLDKKIDSDWQMHFIKGTSEKEIKEKLSSEAGVSSPLANAESRLDEKNPGGIDLQGINVKTSPSSVPMNMPLVDMENFEGLTFRIVRMEEIKDINVVLNTRLKELALAK